MEVPLPEVPPEVLQRLKEQRAKHATFEVKHGQGRPIISTEFEDWRAVAVGSELHFSPKNKTNFFPDFLNFYLKGLLTSEWHKEQLAAPVENQHQIWKWYVSLCNYQKTLKPDADGAYRQEPSGAMWCWNRLAYDLYLIKHNASLQATLLKRIKDKGTFQAARFELCVAACMVVAGFQIKFEDEADNRRKHPEFIATHAKGYSVAVEAKSRHRDGVLDFKGGKASDKVEIEGLLRAALSKNVKLPFYIFVDANLPVTDKIGAGNPWFREMSQTVANLTAEWSPGTFPANGILFCNDPSHYSLDTVLKPHPPFWCYEFPTRSPQYPLPDAEIPHGVARATVQRSHIPNEFPQ